MSTSKSATAAGFDRRQFADKIWNKKKYIEQKFPKNKWYIHNAAALDMKRTYGGVAPWLILVNGKEHCHQGILLDLAEMKALDAKI